MKKLMVLIVFLFSLLNSSHAQGCYKTFYNAGVAAYENLNFEKAINQFRAAKICDDIPSSNEIEQWIEKAQNGYIDVIKKERTKAQSLALTARSILELQKNDNATKAYQFAKYALEMDDSPDSRSAFYESFYQLESNRQRYFYTRDVNVFNSVDDEIQSVDIIDNGQTIFVHNGRSDSLLLFDFKGTRFARLPVGRYWYTEQAYCEQTGMLLVSGRSLEGEMKNKVYAYHLKNNQLSAQPIFEYDSPDREVQALAISKDGSFIVASFNRGHVHVLNAKGELLYALEKEREIAKYLSFSNDAHLGLAYGSELKVVKLEPTSYDTLFTHKERSIWDMKVRLSPNNKYVMIAGGRKARVLSMKGESIAYLGSLNNQFDIGNFSYDEDYAAFGMQLLDMKSRKTQENFYKEVRNMKYAPGTYLLAANINDVKARVWEGRNYQNSDFGVLGGHTSLINQINFSSDSIHIITGAMDNTFKVWNTQIAAVREPNRLEDGILLYAGMIEDSLAVFTCKENELFIWNEKGQLKRNLKYPFKNILTVSDDGKYLFANGDDGNSIEVWDLDFENDNLQFKNGISGIDGADLAAFSSDEKAVFFKSGDTFLSLQTWDMEKGKTYFLSGYNDKLKVLKWSPDNKHIAALTEYGEVTLWDLSEGLEKAKVKKTWRPNKKGNLNGLSFSNDGKHIITSGQDYLVKIWTINGELVKVLQGHSFEVNNANYSPDGKYIITASEDRTAKIWSVEGDLIVTLEGYDSDVKQAVFSKDGRFVITNYGDKSIKIWPFDPKLISDYLDSFDLPQLSEKEKEKYGVGE